MKNSMRLLAMCAFSLLLPTRFAAVIIFALLLLILGGAHAEPAASVPTSGGSGSRYHRLYEKGAGIRARGNVLSMDDLVPYDDMEPILQLRVKVAGEEVRVHLGPRWFVTEHDFTFTRGTPISVVGVRVQLGGEPVIIADEVTTGEKKLVLRDPAGKPKWATKKRR